MNIDSFDMTGGRSRRGGGRRKDPFAGYVSPSEEDIFHEKKCEVQKIVKSEAEIKDPLRSIKVEIGALLTAHREPCTLRFITREYESDYDKLDVRQYGFKTLEELMDFCTDRFIYVGTNDRGEKMYTVRVNEANREIVSLVDRQITREERERRRAKFGGGGGGGGGGGPGSRGDLSRSTGYGAAFQKVAKPLPASREAYASSGSNELALKMFAAMNAEIDAKEAAGIPTVPEEAGEIVLTPVNPSRVAAPLARQQPAESAPAVVPLSAAAASFTPRDYAVPAYVPRPPSVPDQTPVSLVADEFADILTPCDNLDILGKNNRLPVVPPGPSAAFKDPWMFTETRIRTIHSLVREHGSSMSSQQGKRMPVDSLIRKYVHATGESMDEGRPVQQVARKMGALALQQYWSVEMLDGCYALLINTAQMARVEALSASKPRVSEALANLPVPASDPSRVAPSVSTAGRRMILNQLLNTNNTSLSTRPVRSPSRTCAETEEVPLVNGMDMPNPFDYRPAPPSSEESTTPFNTFLKKPFGVLAREEIYAAAPKSGPEAAMNGEVYKDEWVRGMELQLHLYNIHITDNYPHKSVDVEYNRFKSRFSRSPIQLPQKPSEPSNQEEMFGNRGFGANAAGGFTGQTAPAASSRFGGMATPAAAAPVASFGAPAANTVASKPAETARRSYNDDESDDGWGDMIPKSAASENRQLVPLAQPYHPNNNAQPASFTSAPAAPAPAATPVNAFTATAAPVKPAPAPATQPSQPANTPGFGVNGGGFVPPAQSQFAPAAAPAQPAKQGIFSRLSASAAAAASPLRATPSPTPMPPTGSIFASRSAFASAQTGGGGAPAPPRASIFASPPSAMAPAAPVAPVAALPERAPAVTLECSDNESEDPWANTQAATLAAPKKVEPVQAEMPAAAAVPTQKLNASAAAFVPASATPSPIESTTAAEYKTKLEPIRIRYVGKFLTDMRDEPQALCNLNPFKKELVDLNPSIFNVIVDENGVEWVTLVDRNAVPSPEQLVYKADEVVSVVSAEDRAAATATPVMQQQLQQQLQQHKGDGDAAVAPARPTRIDDANENALRPLVKNDKQFELHEGVVYPMAVMGCVDPRCLILTYINAAEPNAQCEFLEDFIKELSDENGASWTRHRVSAEEVRAGGEYVRVRDVNGQLEMVRVLVLRQLDAPDMSEPLYDCVYLDLSMHDVVRASELMRASGTAADTPVLTVSARLRGVERMSGELQAEAMHLCNRAVKYRGNLDHPVNPLPVLYYGFDTETGMMVVDVLVWPGELDYGDMQWLSLVLLDMGAEPRATDPPTAEMAELQHQPDIEQLFHHIGNMILNADASELCADSVHQSPSKAAELLPPEAAPLVVKAEMMEEKEKSEEEEPASLKGVGTLAADASKMASKAELEKMLSEMRVEMNARFDDMARLIGSM